MKVILVDDDKAMLLILKRLLSKIQGVEIVNTFNNSSNVVEFIKDYNWNYFTKILYNKLNKV